MLLDITGGAVFNIFRYTSVATTASMAGHDPQCPGQMAQRRAHPCHSWQPPPVQPGDTCPAKYVAWLYCASCGTPKIPLFFISAHLKWMYCSQSEGFNSRIAEVNALYALTCGMRNSLSVQNAVAASGTETPCGPSVVLQNRNPVVLQQMSSRHCPRGNQRACSKGNPWDSVSPVQCG